jgi:hypothetical protein
MSAPLGRYWGGGFSSYADCVFIAQESAPVLTDIWAVLIVKDGIEGVVRRDTPLGTQPFTTSDRELAHGPLLKIAAELFPGATLRVARFTRVTGP